MLLKVCEKDTPLHFIIIVTGCNQHIFLQQLSAGQRIIGCTFWALWNLAECQKPLPMVSGIIYFQNSQRSSQVKTSKSKSKTAHSVCLYLARATRWVLLLNITVKNMLQLPLQMVHTRTWQMTIVNEFHESERWLFWQSNIDIIRGSFDKLPNGAIPLIFKTGKIRNIGFVENLILNIHRNFFDGDVITVSFVSGFDSSQHRSLHRAFRSLLTDGTNVWTNLYDMLNNKTLMFNI